MHTTLYTSLYTLQLLAKKQQVFYFKLVMSDATSGGASSAQLDVPSTSALSLAELQAFSGNLTTALVVARGLRAVCESSQQLQEQQANTVSTPSNIGYDNLFYSVCVCGIHEPL